jgi:hypothetical protein
LTWPACGDCAPLGVELEWRTGVQEDIASIEDPDVRDELGLAVLDILDDPFIGQELEFLRHIGDLSDCRKLYVDVEPARRPPGPPRFRIVYRLVPDERAPQKVEIVAVGQRADELAYRRALARLNRPFGRRMR